MLSNSFDYNTVRQRSSGVVSVKMTDRPRGVNSFKPGNRIIWDVKKVPRGFMDLKNLTLVFKINAAGSAAFEGMGAYTLFSEVKVETQNGILEDECKNLQNWMALSQSLDDPTMMGNPLCIGSGGVDPLLPGHGVDVNTEQEFASHSITLCSAPTDSFRNSQKLACDSRLPSPRRRFASWLPV